VPDLPVPPELQADIDALGSLKSFGEFFYFQYHACGHKNWFPRDSSTWSTMPIMRAILAYHRSCFECAHPSPELEPSPSNSYWWLQDVHADRDPVPRRPRATPALNPVTIEGIFPDLLRFRLRPGTTAWCSTSSASGYRRRSTSTCSTPAIGSRSRPTWMRSRPRS
jgi:hypothetical protein